MNGIDLCMSCMQPMNGYDVCAHCGWQRGSEQGDPCQLPMGTVLANRYIVGKSLGVGGFGITYVAWDDTLKLKIAIKEYYPAGLASRIPGQTDVVVFSGNKRDQYIAGLQRFLAEARNMAKFSNDPNIVNVIDFFEANNTAYIAMEYLDGITLKQYLKSCGGVLPPEVAIEIIKPVSSALSHMHAQGIIHRDVSPDNIMITSTNTIKLIDFGAARLSMGEKEETLSVMLKPGYAPPEQYRTKSRQGPFTDVYALGATFYRMITGKMPPESTDRALEDDLAVPSAIDPNIPEHIDRAVMRAMALDYTVRFKNTEQFVEALSGNQVVQYPQELVKRRRIRNILLVVAASLAAIAACAAVFLFTKNNGKLKPENLVVWVPGEEKEVNAYRTMAENASNAFLEGMQSMEVEGMTVEIVNIPYDQYFAKLEEAAATGNMPDLYVMTVYDEGSALGDTIDSSEPYYNSPAVLNAGADISSSVKELKNIGEYYFLSSYVNGGEAKLLPTSFRIPVMFINKATTVISSEQLPGLLECVTLADMDAYITGTIGGTWSISKQAAACLLAECTPDEEALITRHTVSSDASYDSFIRDSGGDCVFIGLSSDINWVNKKVTEKKCVPGHEYCVQFTGMWAVGASGSANREKAASQLAVKLLNGSIQDKVYSETACFPFIKVRCREMLQISRITLGLSASSDDADTFVDKAKPLSIEY